MKARKTPRQGRRLPLDGTAKNQRELELTPSALSRHRHGVPEGQAWFGPRTGVAVANHSHIRGRLDGPVSGPASSFSGSDHTALLEMNHSRPESGRLKKTGTSKTIRLLGGVPPEWMKSHTPQGVGGAGDGTSGFSSWPH